jgi:hypothetical protein
MGKARSDRLAMLRRLAAECRAGAGQSDDPTTIETLLHLAGQLEDEAAELERRRPQTAVSDAA